MWKIPLAVLLVFLLVFLYEHYTRGSMLCYWYCHRGSLKEGQTLSFVFTTHDRQVRTFLWLFGYVLFSYYFNSCQNTRVQSGTLGIENHILGSMPNTSQRQKYSLPSNRGRKALVLSSGISLLVSYFEETHLPLGWYQLRLRHFSTNLRSGPIWVVLIHSLQWLPLKLDLKIEPDLRLLVLVYRKASQNDCHVIWST